MASFNEKESVKDLANSSDNVNLHLDESSGVDNLYETNCGSCEGCKLAVDCDNCENCVHNYIEMNVKYSKNPDLLSCLKRMCNSMKIKFQLESGIVVPLVNKTDQHEMKSIKIHTTTQDETGEKQKNCIQLEEEQGSVLQQDTVSKMKRKKTMTTEGTEMESDGEGFRKVILMEYGSSSLEDIIENSDNEDDSDDFSNNESTEMCGSCAGCTTNCGSCWECMEREMVARKETESRLICQNKKCDRKGTGSKVKVIKKGGDEVNIKTVRHRRKRCEICPGCTKLENCQSCYPCLNGKASKNVCKARKCHYLKKKTSQGCGDDNQVETGIKNGDKGAFKIFGPKNKIEIAVKNREGNMKRTKRCGECDGCHAEECGYCQGCQINQHFAQELLIGQVTCLENRCKNPIELSGDMDMISLMAQQDDSSNGTVCPVKISNGILYDFRCFFCKRLPRVGSANRSELMRHYSTNHYAAELRKDFANLENGEQCFLCDVKLNIRSVPSHFGQKHSHVLQYLPTEAAALIEGIQLKTEAHCYPTEVLAFQEVNSPQISESLKVPSDGDQFSSDKGWKANSLGESSEGMGSHSKAMNEWIEEDDSNEDHEVFPLSDMCNSSPDLSGFSGRCSICREEFSQVQETAEHLHKEHGIMGGFTDIIEDCQNFIQGGYIHILQKQHETSNISTSDYKSCLAFESYLMAESQRYATQNSTQDDSKINKKNTCNESSERNNFKSPWIFKK